MKISRNQNRALHLYFKIMAEQCQINGITTRELWQKGFEVPVTLQIFKDNVWRPLQISLFNKNSTQELDSKEINQLFDVINKEFGETYQIHRPFPSIESLEEYQRELDKKLKKR